MTSRQHFINIAIRKARGLNIPVKFTKEQAIDIIEVNLQEWLIDNLDVYPQAYQYVVEATDSQYERALNEVWGNL